MFFNINPFSFLTVFLLLSFLFWCLVLWFLRGNGKTRPKRLFSPTKKHQLASSLSGSPANITIREFGKGTGTIVGYIGMIDKNAYLVSDRPTVLRYASDGSSSGRGRFHTTGVPYDTATDKYLGFNPITSGLLTHYYAGVFTLTTSTSNLEAITASTNTPSNLSRSSSGWRDTYKHQLRRPDALDTLVSYTIAVLCDVRVCLNNIAAVTRSFDDGSAHLQVVRGWGTKASLDHVAHKIFWAVYPRQFCVFTVICFGFRVAASQDASLERAALGFSFEKT
ncbi:hypothetical protein FISHEDRAFT_57844 [Fistulina hepatica ATCC 64428]|uniref:Uncharacterized protein n=1 Tax=Fistulina hepatica ATCC 64428 TaxID=1128425 RepID=A0A0D7AF00_9AGAR|nr:hypothetical protein FISHEDRAFT_57844 [Fistulina hepatica ATCC 64428]